MLVLDDFCLFLLQDEKCFEPVQICLARPKIGLNFSAPPKLFVPAQKLNLLYENHLMVWHKKFGTGTICKSVFGIAQKIWSSINILVRNTICIHNPIVQNHNMYYTNFTYYLVWSQIVLEQTRNVFSLLMLSPSVRPKHFSYTFWT